MLQIILCYYDTRLQHYLANIFYITMQICNVKNTLVGLSLMTLVLFKKMSFLLECNS